MGRRTVEGSVLPDDEFRLLRSMVSLARRQLSKDQLRDLTDDLLMELTTRNARQVEERSFQRPRGLL